MFNILLHAYIGGRAHPDILYKSTGHFILNSVTTKLIILKTTRPNIFHKGNTYLFITRQSQQLGQMFEKNNRSKYNQSTIHSVKARHNGNYWVKCEKSEWLYEHKTKLYVNDYYIYVKYQPHCGLWTHADCLAITKISTSSPRIMRSQLVVTKNKNKKYHLIKCVDKRTRRTREAELTSALTRQMQETRAATINLPRRLIQQVGHLTNT